MAKAKHKAPPRRRAPPLSERSDIYQLGYDIGSTYAAYGHFYPGKTPLMIYSMQGWNFWCNWYWRTPINQRPLNLCELNPPEMVDFQLGWRAGFRDHLVAPKSQGAI